MADKIYKYYAFDPNGYWKAPLEKNHYLYFAKYSEFNDPYEFFFNLNMSGTFAEKQAALSHLPMMAGKTEVEIDSLMFLTDLEAAYAGMAGLFNSMGITCFSKSATEILMWSHYSKGHTGFCLEFDKDKLYQCAKGADKINWVDVQYVKNIPSLSIYKSPTFDGYFKYKYDAWSYENEIRAFRLPTPYFFNPSCITGVIFGLKSHGTKKNSPDWQNLQELKALIVENFGHLLGNLKVARKDKTKFGIYLDPIHIDWIS